MPMEDILIFDRSPNGLRLRGRQLPIVLSVIENRNEWNMAGSHRAIVIQMCETHRGSRTESPEVFNEYSGGELANHLNHGRKVAILAILIYRA